MNNVLTFGVQLQMASTKISKDVWNIILKYLPPDNKLCELPQYITYTSCQEPICLLHPNICKPTILDKINITINTHDIKSMIGPITIKIDYSLIPECIGIFLKKSTKWKPYTFLRPSPTIFADDFDIIIFKNMNNVLYDTLLKHINRYCLENGNG